MSFNRELDKLKDFEIQGLSTPFLIALVHYYNRIAEAKGSPATDFRLVTLIALLKHRLEKRAVELTDAYVEGLSLRTRQQILIDKIDALVDEAEKETNPVVLAKLLDEGIKLRTTARTNALKMEAVIAR